MGKTEREKKKEVDPLKVNQWTQYRGASRDGRVGWLPDRLPDVQGDLAWKASLASDGIGGLVATPDLVVVSGRDGTDRRDRFTAFDVITGDVMWTYEYDAPAELDYGNTPRATPAESGGVLVTLGATGILSGVDALTGVPLWSADLAKRFEVEMPTWGFSGSPLIHDGLIYLQIDKAASLATIDLISGKTKWKVPGPASSYASPMAMGDLIVGVGQDGYFVRRSSDGSLVWSYASEFSGDFGVPSPVISEGQVVFIGENNGVVSFRRQGQTISDAPVAMEENLIPDSHTPVLVGDQLLIAHDGLHSLDMKKGLQENWSSAGNKILSYASIIASDQRALVTTENGWLLLFDINGGALLDQQKLTPGRATVLAHPAVSGDRLFIRVGQEVRCYRLR